MGLDAATGQCLTRLARHAPLPKSDREAFRAVAWQRDGVTARRTMLDPGDRCDRVWLIESGIVGRYDVVRTGLRQFVSLHFPGDICPLHAVCIPTIGWGLTAMTDLIVWQAPLGDVRAILRQAPSLGMALWREGLVEADRVARRLVDVGRRDATARVANLLCELAIATAQSDRQARTAFDLPFTQEQIADVVGLTSVHVNRVIKTLRERRLLRLDRQHIEICDWSALAAIGEFDDRYWCENRAD